MSPQVHVTQDVLDSHTVRRSDLVSCTQAFIDYRNAGATPKQNYALIGAGVAQNPDQFVNITEPHGYNVGGVAIPHGVTNSLHLHFTAEVFIVVRGSYTFRWGARGDEGEVVATAGDVVSVPTWIFRGFTNSGDDDNMMYTVLGGDDNGGIIWSPSVLDEAASHGLYLSPDSRVLDVETGDVVDADTPLVTPISQAYVAELDAFTVDDMAGRVVRKGDRAYHPAALLSFAVTGGSVAFASLIGFGLTENRRQLPPIYNPHGFSLGSLRAEPGQGMLAHVVNRTQVLIVESGQWTVTLNDLDPVGVVLDAEDTLSIPAGAVRTIVSTGAETGAAYLVTAGDDRPRIAWSEEVVKAARDHDVAHDADGYLAPWALVRSSMPDA